MTYHIGMGSRPRRPHNAKNASKRNCQTLSVSELPILFQSFGLLRCSSIPPCRLAPSGALDARDARKLQWSAIADAINHRQRPRERSATQGNSANGILRSKALLRMTSRAQSPLLRMTFRALMIPDTPRWVYPEKWPAAHATSMHAAWVS